MAAPLSQFLSPTYLVTYSTIVLLLYNNFCLMRFEFRTFNLTLRTSSVWCSLSCFQAQEKTLGSNGWSGLNPKIRLQWLKVCPSYQLILFNGPGPKTLVWVIYAFKYMKTRCQVQKHQNSPLTVLWLFESVFPPYANFMKIRWSMKASLNTNRFSWW